MLIVANEQQRAEGGGGAGRRRVMGGGIGGGEVYNLSGCTTLMRLPDGMSEFPFISVRFHFLSPSSCSIFINCVRLLVPFSSSSPSPPSLHSMSHNFTGNWLKICRRFKKRPFVHFAVNWISPQNHQPPPLSPSPSSPSDKDDQFAGDHPPRRLQINLNQPGATSENQLIQSG